MRPCRGLLANLSHLTSAIVTGGCLLFISPATGLPSTWLPLILAVITTFTDKGMHTFDKRTGYRWFVPYGVMGRRIGHPAPCDRS